MGLWPRTRPGSGSGLRVLLQQEQLPYERYLVEVQESLEQDSHFRAKLKNATIDDIMVRRARRPGPAP